jgi:hypothetical protein
VLSSLAGVVRLASLAACLIVVVSFGLFVVNRTGEASKHQQAELNTPAVGAHVGPPPAPPGKEGSARKTIDEVSKELTSPFSAVTAGSSSQWLIRVVDLVLALLVYGLCVGYITRAIRVRL